jgi:membrane protease YdiL (CAAX protease family)
VALGAEPPTSAELATWTNIVPFFLFALVVPILGPWEEPGFRGYALSRLRMRHSPLAAGLMVGAMAVAWHLPLFFTDDIPLADVVLILAAGVVFAALVWGSGGSVLVAMVMHAASNAVSGEFVSQMFLEDAAVLGWIRAGVWCVFAAATVALAGTAFRARPAPRADAEATSVGVTR